MFKRGSKGDIRVKVVGGGQAYSSGGRGGGFLREVRGGCRLYFMRVKLHFIYYESKTFYGAY